MLCGLGVAALPLVTDQYRLIWLVGLLQIPAIALNVSYRLRMQHRMGHVGLSRAVNGLVLTSVVVLGYHFTTSPVVLMWGLGTGSAVAAIYTICVVRIAPPNDRTLRSDLECVASNWRQAWPILTNALCIQVLIDAGVIVVVGLRGASQGALYSAAFRPCLAALLIGGLFSAAAYPSWARMPVKSLEHRLASEVALIGSFLLAGYIYVLAEPHFLIVEVYGRQYAAASVLLCVLAGFVVLGVPNTLLTQSLLASGRFRQQMRIALFATLVTAILLPVLALMAGALGAAVAGLVTEMCTFAWACHFWGVGLLKEIVRRAGRYVLPLCVLIAVVGSSKAAGANVLIVSIC